MGKVMMRWRRWKKGRRHAGCLVRMEMRLSEMAVNSLCQLVMESEGWEGLRRLMMKERGYLKWSCETE